VLETVAEDTMHLTGGEGEGRRGEERREEERGGEKRREEGGGREDVRRQLLR
jgi:hypothetical protein